MQVNVEIEEDEFDGDHTSVAGLRLTCTRCGHEVEVFGTDERSAKRGAVMLRDECPRGERNFYIVDWD
jgi:hypothetical protein